MVSAALGVVLLYLSNALSASAGLGGGSLNVPIYMNVFGFSYHNATILSLCALMGNYLFQVLINLDKPHPTAVSSITRKSKSLISWETVLILSPSEWGGSNLALVVLTLALTMSLHKGYALFREENIRLAEESQLSEDDRNQSLNSSYQQQDSHEESSPLLLELQSPTRSSILQSIRARKAAAALTIVPRYLYCYMDRCDKKTNKQHMNHLQSASNSGSGSEGDLTRAEAEREYMSLDPSEGGEGEWEIEVEVPWLIVGAIGAIWLLYAVFYLLLKRYSVCSWSYAVLLLFLYPLLLCEAGWGLHYVIRQQKKEKQARLQQQQLRQAWTGQHEGADEEDEQEGEINWNACAIMIPLITFAIGFLTSLMGIGGGELVGPLLLTLKAVPSSSSATTSFMSLLNSSSSVLHYLLLGEIPVGYACGMFVVGALGGISGRAGALYVSINYGRSSVMVFALALVLFVSFFMYFSYIVSDPSDFQFNSICSR